MNRWTIRLPLTEEVVFEGGTIDLEPVQYNGVSGATLMATGVTV